MTRTGPYMMVNGSRTRDPGSEKCFFKTARSAMASGAVTRFTERGSTFRAMAIDTRDTSTMD